MNGVAELLAQRRETLVAACAHLHDTDSLRLAAATIGTQRDSQALVEATLRQSAALTSARDVRRDSLASLLAHVGAVIPTDCVALIHSAERIRLALPIDAEPTQQRRRTAATVRREAAAELVPWARALLDSHVRIVETEEEGANQLDSSTTRTVYTILDASVPDELHMSAGGVLRAGEFDMMALAAANLAADADAVAASLDVERVTALFDVYLRARRVAHAQNDAMNWRVALADGTTSESESGGAESARAMTEARRWGVLVDATQRSDAPVRDAAAPYYTAFLRALSLLFSVDEEADVVGIDVVGTQLARLSEFFDFTESVRYDFAMHDEVRRGYEEELDNMFELLVALRSNLMEPRRVWSALGAVRRAFTAMRTRLRNAGRMNVSLQSPSARRVRAAPLDDLFAPFDAVRDAIAFNLERRSGVVTAPAASARAIDSLEAAGVYAVALTPDRLFVPLPLSSARVCDVLGVRVYRL